MTILYNGCLLDSAASQGIPFDDRGYLLGDGLFETMRVKRGVIPLFDAHLARLEKGLSLLAMKRPFDIDELKKQISTLLSAHDFAGDSCIIRLTVTRAGGNRGLAFSDNNGVNYLLTCHPLSAAKEGVSVCISNIRRNQNSPITQVKTVNFLDGVLAKNQAQQAAYDDAVFLNTNGFIAESTSSNVFFVKQGVVLTPPVSDGLMPGITRNVVLDLCDELGIPKKESSLTLDDISGVEEMFLTNCVVGIQSVAQMDALNFTNKKDGVTALLSQKYIECYPM